MPAQPHVAQLLRIAALGHDVLDLRDVHALAGHVAIFAFPVIRLQRGGDLAHLLAQLGILGSRRGQRQFEQQEFAGKIRRHLHAVEALGLLDQFGGDSGDFVIHIRCERLAVISDEVLVNPVRVVPLDTQLSELPLGFVHEVLGFGECGSGGSLRLKNNGSSETEYCECDEHLHIVSEFYGRPVSSVVEALNL